MWAVFARVSEVLDYLKNNLSITIAGLIDRLDATISSRQVSWGAVAGTKTNIDNTAVNVGSNVDASSATGSVHAKLKDIKTALNGVSPIKSIQRVQFSFPTWSSNAVADITIANVNINKTVIVIPGGLITSNVGNSTRGNWSVGFVSGTTLRLTISGDIFAGPPITIPIQVVEYN